MQIDPNNPIVKLCAAGVEAEMSGHHAEALELYNEAWLEKETDYEACIVAHYMARLQETPELVLKWNALALDHAGKVNPEAIESFYPSLYLNMGKSYEDIEDMVQAKKFYLLAQKTVGVLPEDGLGAMTRDGIARALVRVGE